MAVQLTDLIRRNGCCRVVSAASVLAFACIACTAAFAAATPSAKLAALTPGEFWTWSLSGSIAQPASGQTSGSTVPLSGTMFEDVEVLPFQGSPTLALVATDDLTVGGVSIFGNQAPPKGIFYIQQDPATHEVLVIGDNQGPNGALRIAARPAVFIPGAWSLSTSYDDTLSFLSGDSTTLKLGVTGTTTVTTPLGDFAAWVAPNVAVDSTGVVHTGTDYWTPELGSPALFKVTTMVPNGGGVTEISAVLTGASTLGTPLPEPATLAVFGCSLLGLAGARRRHCILMRHRLTAALASLVIACPLLATNAWAVPIAYTETTIGSGTLAGAAFTNSQVTITFAGDTSGVTPFALGTFINPVGVGTVTVPGFGTAIFTAGPSTTAVDDQTFNGAGIGAQAFNPPNNQPGPPLVLAVTALPFGTYDLTGAIGPVTGRVLFEPGVTFSTSSGDFVLTTAGNVTFTATLTAVPEPMSIALLGVGLLRLGLARHPRPTIASRDVL